VSTDSSLVRSQWPIGEFHLNTQSHAILNFFLLRWSLGERISRLKRINTVLFSGALLPDLPIFSFFFWYTLVEQTPQSVQIRLRRPFIRK
jgi:hypothetical protein